MQSTFWYRNIPMAWSASIPPRSPKKKEESKKKDSKKKSGELSKRKFFTYLP